MSKNNKLMVPDNFGFPDVLSLSALVKYLYEVPILNSNRCATFALLILLTQRHVTQDSASGLRPSNEPWAIIIEETFMEYSNIHTYHI